MWGTCCVASFSFSQFSFSFLHQNHHRSSRDDHRAMTRTGDELRRPGHSSQRLPSSRRLQFFRARGSTRSSHSIDPLAHSAFTYFDPSIRYGSFNVDTEKRVTTDVFLIREREAPTDGTLGEGKKRQIRRVCEGLNLGVVDLLRVGVGGCDLGDLPEGRWRLMTHEETDDLKSFNGGVGGGSGGGGAGGGRRGGRGGGRGGRGGGGRGANPRPSWAA